MPPADKPERFGPINIQGRPLRCGVCDHGSFWEQEIELATPLSNLLTFDAWNGTAQCAICERCGHVHMFISPATIGQSDTSIEGRLQEG